MTTGLGATPAPYNPALTYGGANFPYDQKSNIQAYCNELTAAQYGVAPGLPFPSPSSIGVDCTSYSLAPSGASFTTLTGGPSATGSGFNPTWLLIGAAMVLVIVLMGASS